MRKLISLITILSISLCSTSYAEEVIQNNTTGYLLSIYSRTNTKVTKEDVDELNSNILKLSELLKKQQNADSFNNSVDSAEEYKKLTIINAKSIVNDLLNECSKVSGKIEESFYSDPETLKKLDSEYKSYYNEANSILQSADSISIPDKVVTYEKELSNVVDEVKSKRDLININNSGNVIGDINNIGSPVDSEFNVNSGWGTRVERRTRSTIEFNPGIEISCPIGSNIKSMFNGTVLTVGENWMMGKYIRIDHGDGVVSVYGHLSKVLVYEGKRVNQYDHIGLTGSTGQSAIFPSVYIGLFINGNSVDPMILYKRFK